MAWSTWWLWVAHSKQLPQPPWRRGNQEEFRFPCVYTNPPPPRGAWGLMPTPFSQVWLARLK